MDMGKCVCGQNTKALKDKMKMYQFEFETREQSTQESYNFFFMLKFVFPTVSAWDLSVQHGW